MAPPDLPLAPAPLALHAVLVLGALACAGPREAAPAAHPAPPASNEVALPAPSAQPADPAPREAAATGWQAFGADASSLFESMLAQWSPTTQCETFDYFPNGGIQSFWCHRPEGLTLQRVRELAGVAIFSSGPHPAGSLRLDAPHDFGHYNPAFARWLVDKAAPAPRGSVIQKATQSSYEANLRPLAEIFWKTYQKTRSEQACFEREKSLYASAVARKALPRDYHERWFFFMNPHFCKRAAAGQVTGQASNFFFDNGFDGGVSGNVTKTAVGFWVRRSLDGTLDTFAEGLKKLIASYQPSLLSAPPEPAVQKR